MSTENSGDNRRPDPSSQWVVDTRELGKRPGQSSQLYRRLPTSSELGVPDVITIAAGTEVTLDLLLESVVEGVLATGTVSAPSAGYCVRCLDPVSETIESRVTELFAYEDPEVADDTADAEDVSPIVDDMLDLEPVARDALVLGLPHAPVCSPDCLGLCAECGEKWAELEPGHGHEKIDPRWAALVDKLDDLTDETSDEASTGRPDDTP